MEWCTLRCTSGMLGPLPAHGIFVPRTTENVPAMLRTIFYCWLNCAERFVESIIVDRIPTAKVVIFSHGIPSVLSCDQQPSHHLPSKRVRRSMNERFVEVYHCVYHRKKTQSWLENGTVYGIGYSIPHSSR